MMLHERNQLSLLFWVAIALLLAIALLVVSTMPVYAQDTAPSSCPDPLWHAAYWNNTTLTGEPVVVRCEPQVDYNWGSGAPAAGVNADFFSARWMRYIWAESGTYRFAATSDDGIRVFVDEQLLVNEWYDHGVQTVERDTYLTSGQHLLRVEFFENRGAAVVRLGWSAVQSAPIYDWRGAYYDTLDLMGAPYLVRNDPVIDFYWGSGAPASGMAPDTFSVRWTRQLPVTSGTYRFVATADDGVRLWVNNQLLVDAWRIQSATTYHADIYLSDGSVPVTLEYFEDGGVAEVRLVWYRVEEGHGDGDTDQAWRGEYFDNRHLSGSPAVVRSDRAIDFDWGGGSPVPGRIDDDNFSVRWTRTRHFDGGRYRFSVTCDDGVRLYIDGTLVMDEWHDMPATRMSETVRLDRGTHTIRMEYYEHEGDAVAELGWDRTESERQVGNIITCAPPQPDNNAWIKIYRRDPSGEWIAMTPKGIGAICSTGYLKIDGLPVDTDTYGSSGHPYCVELWVNGALVNAVGNTDRGEAEFRVYADVDNYTPWQCPPPT
jgi:hypothetical protein